MLKAVAALALAAVMFGFMFGFIFTGHGSTGSGAHFSLVSSNKVFAPPIHAPFGGGFGFQFRPAAFRPAPLFGSFGFRFGFLDP